MKKYETLRVLLLVILVLALSLIPYFTLYKKRDTTKERLFGEPSRLQGVLHVWNVDTFEGGTMSKAELLNKAAREFEKQNKGLYVFIENLTVDEFMARKSGELPDVISFGLGLDVQDVLAFAQTAADQHILPQASVQNAYAWCMGGYFALTSADALERASKTEEDFFENIYNLGYKKTLGKNEIEVKSVTLGSSEYHSAYEALCQLGNVELEKIDDAYANQTNYEAYCKFGNSKATVLFGTTRDLVRFENKLSTGRVSEIYAKFVPWTDMLQCAISITKPEALRCEYSQKFCLFLQSEKVQTMVADSGLLPIIELERGQNTILDRTITKELKNIIVKKIGV